MRRFIAALRPLAAFEKAAKRLESGNELPHSKGPSCREGLLCAANGRTLGLSQIIAH